MAKQVNKPFLIILTLLILGGIGGALVMYKYKPFRRAVSPETLMAEGEAHFAQGNFNDAAGKFGQATIVAPNKPEPFARLGDAMYQLSRKDPEFVNRAIAQWNQSLQADPNYVPALQSMLNAYIDEMDAVQRGESIIRVRDTAARLVKIDPNNLRAASYQHIATLAGWFNNEAVSQQDVTTAVEGLKELTKKDPANADLPYNIARASIQTGQDAQRQHRNDEALKHYAQAAAIMDAAAKEQPDNVMMQLRAGQLYDVLDVIVPRDLSGGVYDRGCTAYLERAKSLAKPGDKAYRDVYSSYADRKLKNGDRIESEKIYRELHKQLPDDAAVRIMLAGLLQADRGTRREAVDLLADTVKKGEEPNAPRTFVARVLQYRAILQLASARMDLLEEVRDDSNRRDLMQLIEADVAKAEARMPENPESLKVRGRLYLIKGDIVKALQALTKARDMLDGVSARSDFALMYSLARANLQAHNNEDARRQLDQIVRAFPTYTPARILLVDLLLNSNEVVEAAKHIDELEKQAPNSPLVARLKLFTLDVKKDRAAVDGLFHQLPEETRPQKLEKARIAIAIDRVPDAIRLMENVRASAPTDARIADRLAQLYLFQRNPDKAKEVIEEALKSNPKDAQLLILQKRMANGTTEDIIELADRLIDETPDPLLRALQRADLQRLRGNAEGMYNHLIEAEKIAPNDPRVQDQLFSYYLATRQFKLAEKYIEPLARANFGGAWGMIHWWKYYAAKGDYDAAVRIGREFTQKMPMFAVSWITLGQAHKLKREWEPALYAFNTARERQSTNREAIRGSIDCLYALGRHAEALKIINQGRQYFPGDMGLAEMELEYHLQHGDPRNAMTPLLENLKREPNVLNHYLNVGSMYYRLSIQPGLSADQATDSVNKGIAVLKEAVEKFPDDTRPYISLAELQAATKQRAAGEATLKAMVEHPKLKDRAEPKLFMAEYFVKGNEPDKAERYLRDALAVSPKSQDIRRKLAVMLAGNKRVDEALKVLDDAGPDANSPMLFNSRLEILTTHGRHAEVEAVANKLLQEKPNETEAMAILANAQFSQGKYDAAIATADKVLAKNPRNHRALIARAMSKLNRANGDPGDAIPDLIAYRDLNPHDHKPRVSLAEAYNRKQQHEAAMNELRAAVGIAPSDPLLRVMLLDQYRTAQPPRSAEGDQLVKDTQSVPAVAGDADWLKAESTWMSVRKRSDAAVDAARRAMVAGKHEPRYVQHFLAILLDTKNEALLLKETDPMVAADPNRYWLFQARGIARKKLNDPKADEEFRRAVNTALASKDVIAVERSLNVMGREVGADKALALIEPRVNENPRYLLATAQLYQQKGLSTQALRIVEQAMAQRSTAPPETQVAILAYAGLIYSTGKPMQADKAVEAYQGLVALQPNNVDALNQLAWLLAVEVSPARLEEANKHSERAYKLVHGSGRFSSSVFDTHGWVLVLCGKYDEGIEVLQQIVAKFPTVEAHYHLSEAYRKKEKAEDSKAQLDKAKQLIKFNDDNKIPVDADLRQKVRDAEPAATVTGP